MSRGCDLYIWKYFIENRQLIETEQGKARLFCPCILSNIEMNYKKNYFFNCGGMIEHGAGKREH